jgi:hypothetical protein
MRTDTPNTDPPICVLRGGLAIFLVRRRAGRSVRLGVWSEWLATLGAALPDRSLARPHLWLKPAVSHDTREDDGDNDQRSDSTTQ